MAATMLACAAIQGCGDCAGVGLARITPTERTIRVGESFIAQYEEGGSCREAFAPVPNRVRWSTGEPNIIAVDSITGLITYKRYDDALVTVNAPLTTIQQSLFVHVR